MKKVVGKQEFSISSGLAEVLGPTPLDCEGVGCRAVATTLPPLNHTRAVHSDMMKGGTGASDKPMNDARGSALVLKAAEVEAANVYRANHATEFMKQHYERETHTPAHMQVKDRSSSSEAALALDAAYAQRLADFMADVKFKATDHVQYPHAHLINIFFTIKNVSPTQQCLTPSIIISRSIP